MGTYSRDLGANISSSHTTFPTQQFLTLCRQNKQLSLQMILSVVLLILCCFPLFSHANAVATTLRFDGTQYVHVRLPEASITEVEDISLRFRTRQASGVLLTTASQKVEDLLELRLHEGRLELTVTLDNHTLVSDTFNV